MDSNVDQNILKTAPEIPRMVAAEIKYSGFPIWPG
jgi:hypothetical protein